jgi:hypothetical protein
LHHRGIGELFFNGGGRRRLEKPQEGISIAKRSSALAIRSNFADSPAMIFPASVLDWKSGREQSFY